MTDVQVISGTRRAIKEMADGTIRVQIDIDPTCRSAFWSLFPNIDMPVAIAPLIADFERKQPEIQPDDHGKHYAVLYKSGWFHNPKVSAALGLAVSLSPDDRINCIKEEIYGAFDVVSLTEISPEAFVQWCEEMNIRATLPAAFGGAA